MRVLMGVEIPMSLQYNGDPRMLQIRDAQLQHICVGQTYFSVILCMQVDVTLHAVCCDKSADPFGLTSSQWKDSASRKQWRQS
jgi:hypothetical protein